MIYVIAKIEIKPGTLEQVIAAALPCIEATRKEEGCLTYDLNHSVTNETSIVFVESWESRAALEAHFGQPHMATWRGLAAPHFVGRTIEVIDAASVENL